MFIHEASKRTGLTKKAIEYYTLQGLLTPHVLENGYRMYSPHDITTLNQICVFRKLDLSIEEIRFVLSDPTNTALHQVSVKKELELQRTLLKKEILDKLIIDPSCPEIQAELSMIEKNKSITDRLLDAFPGYFGRCMCLHFSRFLHHPITTDEQQSAFDTIISFLDNTPSLDFPSDLEAYVIECTNHLGTKQINSLFEDTQKSIENPDTFLSDNKELLEQYLAYKQSDAYKLSPAYKLMKFMKQFFNTSGYYDIFLPAMEQLSSSYSKYRKQLDTANKKLITNYPEIETMTDL